ncbi:polysaccharide pyruvyl transferase family protein [Akkermansiaceae bacterium]|nr:polysaccharide pyruvyl transferase family protein [Akkermansiaceae bacterium]MDB4423424.1 polysaccharide pyruvyl transferase family protein [bacterium]
MFKKKVIRLFWYKRLSGKYGNFGDELGPYLIGKLSTLPIEHVPIPRDGLFLLLTYLKNLFLGRYPLSMFPSVFKSLFKRGNYITGIGSIIGWSSGSRIVWGSGILFYNEKISNGFFLAVRGQYTQRRLRNLGYEVPDVLGDPALLLPLVYHPEISKGYRLGVIPHHTHTEGLSHLASGDDVVVIDLLDNVETIIRRMLSCECVISTSLHGIIVAHAYGIPALWYEYKDVQWHGSDVKFFDYFSSVGIEEYVPLQMPTSEINLERVLRCFNDYAKHALPQVNLCVIQKKLLDVAPFPLDRWNGDICDDSIQKG